MKLTILEWLLFLALAILLIALAYFLSGCSTPPPVGVHQIPPAPRIVSRPMAGLQEDPPLARVTLAWDASPSPEVIGYRVHQGTNSGAYTTIWITDTNLIYTITNLAAGVRSFFAVTAFSTNQESVFSNEISYEPPAGGAFFTLSTLTASSPDGPWLPFTNLPPVSFTNPGGAAFFKLAITWTNLP